MDKYDRAIELLGEFKNDPENFRLEIRRAWFDAGLSSPTGCLFQFASPSCRRLEEIRIDGERHWIGCPTLIHNSTYYVAWTKELTDRIRADSRIPNRPDDITYERLPVFAEYQREMDRTIRKTSDW